MASPGGYDGQSAIHVVGVQEGEIVRYKKLITFESGSLDPSATPAVGSDWIGPLCGTSYSFAAPNARQAPSHNLDEIWIEVSGARVQISSQLKKSEYPPGLGPLQSFLEALRGRLPNGGRFRVNERGRAFTSNGNLFIGVVPVDSYWFKPMSASKS